MKKPGLFITFEGLDGCGKSTQARLLARALKQMGYAVLLTREPGGTKLGNRLRRFLLHPASKVCPEAELLLYLADRAQHVQEIIMPALQAGKIVLCDRFNDSTVAYQGGARGFDLEWIQKLCLFATQDLQPDCTLYLDIDPQEGLSRVKRSKDRIEKEGVSFHQKIRSAYLAIAKIEPNRFHVLDGSKSPDDVFQHALELVSKELATVEDRHQKPYREPCS